ncbi:NAD(P)-binding protein [Penicillium hispanicum]|uniref:NAD(P)-binding protein n=1 Tax=Penicillium hispanicum TaxID=1080232 RepID=UPI00253FC0DC|nr:NAD(P)-binding protein [Penicillium hispanicum]KAJ5578693.1 NAD(P)-binding protein [Penicillium hispanicum]
MSIQRSVLITGCSDGSLGAALAVAFHEAGLHVYATARNPDKMKGLAAKGIETLVLDVLSESSIADCVRKLPSLDILVNNAGQGYSMPIADISLATAKQTFDLNVWAYIAMIQAFLPLLLKSPQGMVVNQTSLTSVISVPFQAVYNASKAAIASFSDSLRLELEPFGINVIDLKTGNVKSNMASALALVQPTLPKGSIYEPARDVLESVIRQEKFQNVGTPADQWAKQVTTELLKKNPPWTIWKGQSACVVRLSTVLPAGTLDGTLKDLAKLPEISQKLQK